ncbi:MAG: DUF3006 domain-containing protein [Firmicutes bacterium]|nr:DUF3006 domain-containing protein [Bacillota bacterium]
MRFAVDRIEEGLMICEALEGDDVIRLEKGRYPDIKEGDILYEKDGEYFFDEEETAERKKNMRERLNRLFKKK